MVTIEFLFLFLGLILAFSIGLNFTLLIDNKVNKKIHSTPFIFLLGISILILTTAFFYQLGLSITNIYYLTVLLTLLSLVITSEKVKESLKLTDVNYLYGVIFLIFYALIGSENYKSFQGFIYDRFSYLSTALMYKEFSYSTLMDMKKNIFFIGNTTPLYIEPLINRVTGSLTTRPVIEYTFSFLTVPFGSSSYLLANAFENLARILFFSVCFATLSCVVKNKRYILLISVAMSIGFTGQFLKDYNAWSMQFAIPLSLISIYFILNESEIKNNLSTAMIIYGAALAIYPEGMLFISAIYIASLLIIHFKDIPKLINYIYIFSGSVLIYLVLNYSRLKFIISQFNNSNSFGLGDWIKNLYQFLPYADSFADKSIFFENLIQNPHNLNAIFFHLLSFIPLTFGYYVTSKYGFILQAMIFVMIAYILLSKKISFQHKQRVIFITIITIAIIFSFILFISGRYYGFSKSVCYINSICTLCLIIYTMSIYKRSIVAKFAIYTFLILSCIFSMANIKSILSKSNKDYIDYTFAYDRIKPNLKIKNHIETSSIIPYLKYCNSIDIQIEDRWLSAYAKIMAQSSKAAHVNPNRRLTGIWDGDAMEIKDSPNVKYDCTITTYEASNKNELDLVFNNYTKKLSVKRGPL